MPIICQFYGITIRMFYADHAPPHFHAFYCEYTAIIDIHELQLREGVLPRRALNLVLDWAELHKEELLDDWKRAQDKAPLQSISPLE